MSKVCEICGKKPMTGNAVSHSHRKTKKIWTPNLQKTNVEVKGKNKSIKICTRCLRTLRTKAEVKV